MEFENTGDIYNPSFALPDMNTRGLTNVGSFATTAFISPDGSNDYDLVSGESNGGFTHFINQGNELIPQFMQSQDDTPFDLGDIGFLSSPTFIDVDGDLDMDMFSGDIGGDIHFFRNNNLFSPMFGFKQTNVFDLYNYALVSSPSAGDIDNGGDVELLVGSSESHL